MAAARLMGGGAGAPLDPPLLYTTSFFFQIPGDGGSYVLQRIDLDWLEINSIVCCLSFPAFQVRHLTLRSTVCVHWKLNRVITDIGIRALTADERLLYVS